MSHYQFIVIGNGLIGSAAGRYLSEWSHSVALIGPGEPADHATHTGVFSSHYDQGRLCRPRSVDPVWNVTSKEASSNYAKIEAASGIPFHVPVGRIHAKRYSPEERAELIGWLETVHEELGTDYKFFAAGDRSWKTLFPYLDYPDDYDLLYEPAPAGVVNPRQMRQAENEIARQNGADLIPEMVTQVTRSAAQVTVVTESGRTLTADKVLVACGAFTNFNNLLPRPIPLRMKTETMVWGTVSAETAERLKEMPGTGYDIDDPAIDDIYMAPPLLYPDGTYKIKMGCNTAHELWPETLEELQAWFRSGQSDLDKEPMERALRGQLPDVDFVDITTKRCIVTYTPSGYPTIDCVDRPTGGPGDTDSSGQDPQNLNEGRIYVAAGGNGTGAQGADTLGHVAAGLMFDGRWHPDLPRALFRADNGWGESEKKLTKAQARAMKGGQDG